MLMLLAALLLSPSAQIAPLPGGLAGGLPGGLPGGLAGELPGELLVKLRPGVAAADLPLHAGESAAGALPAPRGIDRVGLSRWLRVRVAPGAEDSALARLAGSPLVERAERNAAGPALVAPLPDDPFLSFQWHVQQASDVDMDLPEAWQLRGTFDADPLLVAVIDAGFDVASPPTDLAGMLWDNPGELANGLDDDGNGFVDDLHGYDFVVGEADPDGGHPHGIWIPSILAARVDNGIDIAGVAPGLRMLHARAFDDSGDFPAGGPYPGKLAAAAAILYVVDEGARLVNNSWGDGTGPTAAINDAVVYAHDNGALMVFAAGNDGHAVGWPSQLPEAFAVAGLSSSGAKWVGSNYGPWVDISAAAEGVPIIDQSLGVATGNGTSAAAPAVTGVVALLLSEDPTFPAADQRRLVELGAASVDAFNPGFIGQLGAGFVNAHRSLLLLEPVQDLGGGLAGTTAPHLHGYGGTQVGQIFAFSVNGGPPGAVAALVVGKTAANGGAFGGTVVPSPDVLAFVQLDVDGRFHLELPLPVALPPATSVAWLQALVQDGGAPKGVAISNALRVHGL
jgi:hypothetical protein